MIRVDLSELKNRITEINGLIASYEELKLNLFNVIKNSAEDWQDTQSIKFQNSITLEKEEAEKILQSLNDKEKVLSYIYSKYITLGKKIKCDLDKKDTIIDLFTKRGEEAKSIIRDFDKIDRSFYYEEIETINNVKQKIISVSINIGEIIKSLREIYGKIKDIESDIAKKISELDDVKINSFEYNIGG